MGTAQLFYRLPVAHHFFMAPLSAGASSYPFPSSLMPRSIHQSIVIRIDPAFLLQVSVQLLSDGHRILLSPVKLFIISLANRHSFTAGITLNISASTESFSTSSRSPLTSVRLNSGIVLSWCVPLFNRFHVLLADNCSKKS